MPAHSRRPHLRSALAVSLILGLIWQLMPVGRAHALMCTSVASGNWSAPATWSGCNGVTPTAADDVVIVDGHIIHLDVPAATVRSLSLLDGSVSSSLILDDQNALTVTTNVTAASSLAYARKTIAVGDGVLTIGGNLTLAGGILTRIAEVTINTGTVTIAGDINVNGTNAEVTFTSGGMLNVGGTFQSGGAFTAASGATVQYNSPDAQTMGGYAYYDLILSNTGVKTPGGSYSVSHALTIEENATLNQAARTLTLTGGAQITISGTLDFSSSSGLIRSGTSGTTTLTIGPNGLIRTFDQDGLGPTVNASLQTQTGGAWNVASLATNGSVEYYRNATSGQTVTDRDYNHLIITGAAQTKTWTLASPRTIHGNLTINTSAPLTLSGAQELSLRQNLSNNGVLTPGTVTIRFGGSEPQVITGTATTTFNNLVIDNSSGITLNGVNASVNGLLTFTNGIFTTGLNTLVLTANATIAGASPDRYVNGQLQKSFTSGAAQTFKFEIGDDSHYTPVELTNFNVTAGGNLTAFTTPERHPQFISANIGDSYIRRYWTLTPGSNLATNNYDLTATFAASDLVDAPDTNNLIIQKCSGAAPCTWSSPITHSSTSSTVTGTGFTSFSDFFAGQGGTPTPVTLSYFLATRQNDLVQFGWSTETETGNVGFNLYVLHDDTIEPINAELIPTNAPDSLIRQDYTYSAAVAGDTYYIEDINVFGETNRHGPFQLGQEYGNRLEPDPIDWSAIRAEHAIGPDTFPLTLGPDSPTDAPTPLPELQPSGRNPGTLNLQVRQTGLYRITYEMLRDQGLNLLGVPKTKIQLTNQGQAVAIYTNAAQTFGPGSYIEFLGKSLDTIYTDTNVYTLEVGSLHKNIPTSGMAAIQPAEESPASFTETIWVDNQRAYAAYYALDDGWYDTSMLAYTTSKTWNFPFEITELADPSAPAALRLFVWGVTDWPQSPDHHLLVSLNGVPLASEWFDGLVVHTIEINLPANLLRPGTNTLELTLPGDTGSKYDMVNLDKFSLTYQRTFQAQDGRLTFRASGKQFKVFGLPTKQVVVYRKDKNELSRIEHVVVEAEGETFSAVFPGSGRAATYFVSSTDSLYVPTFVPGYKPTSNLEQPATYLVIAHPDFMEGLKPLLEARQAQGYTVNVVNVNDLYAQYTYNIFHPLAIQKYITHAHQKLGTRYILLVGGDTYDYRNYLGLNSVSFIPSLYASTGEYVRLVPVDPLFADVNGDNLPDLAIGRFPVRTQAELDLMVAKTLAYERKDYTRSAVFASDQFDGYVSFRTINQEFAASLPAGWQVETIHLDEVGVPTAQNQLIQAMNRGTSLVTYTGHSGPTSWTFSDLFSTKQAAALTNAGRPFVVVQWGCWNNYYIDPLNNHLVQAFLFSGDRGAAAVLGAVTVTNSEAEKQLGQLLTPRLVRPGATIGQALQRAKVELSKTHPELLDVLLGWTLMGDPALTIDDYPRQ